MATRLEVTPAMRAHGVVAAAGVSAADMAAGDRPPDEVEDALQEAHEVAALAGRECWVLLRVAP